MTPVAFGNHKNKNKKLRITIKTDSAHILQATHRATLHVQVFKSKGNACAAEHVCDIT